MIMKKCPDALTWQALLDNEEQGPELWAHLDRCPACRELYCEIASAATLAGELFTGESLPEGFSGRVLRRIKPFPAGLVAALLFLLLSVAAVLADPGGLKWWFAAGITRQVSFFLDALISMFFLLQNAGPAWLLTAAAALVALEILFLHKIIMKTAED